jgi:predicted nucleic acid-binding protein
MEALALTRSRRLLAPPLLRAEMAQVAVTKCARLPDRAPLLEQQYERSLQVSIRLVEPSWPTVVKIAREHGISAYDAAYLQLAQELRVPLATFDERLGMVAEGLGLRAAPGSA